MLRLLMKRSLLMTRRSQVQMRLDQLLSSKAWEEVTGKSLVLQLVHLLLHLLLWALAQVETGMVVMVVTGPLRVYQLLVANGELLRVQARVLNGRVTQSLEDYVVFAATCILERRFT
jgi:hypothetical protein